MYENLPPGQNPILPTSRLDLLAPFVHTDEGRRMLRSLPGEDVAFIRGRISARQIQMHRLSYVNAILIQSRGRRLAVPCTRCRSGQGRLVFPECRQVPGAFGGACANCKWPDKASQCSVRDEFWHSLDGLREGSRMGGGGRHTRSLGSSQDNPINVDAEIIDLDEPINLDPEEGDHPNDPINLDPEENEEWPEIE